MIFLDKIKDLIANVDFTSWPPSNNSLLKLNTNNNCLDRRHHTARNLSSNRGGVFEL